jgi:hypothetical protein
VLAPVGEKDEAMAVAMSRRPFVAPPKADLVILPFLAGTREFDSTHLTPRMMSLSRFMFQASRAKLAERIS